MMGIVTILESHPLEVILHKGASICPILNIGLFTSLSRTDVAEQVILLNVNYSDYQESIDFFLFQAKQIGFL